MRIPKHIAIIPDGNRRWARAHGQQPQSGYDHGLSPGVAALNLARQYGAEEVTFYGFTTDNCHRPRAQVEAFQHACVDAVEQIGAQGGALLVVGNMASSDFPPQLARYHTRQQIGTDPMRVNFLVNYSWEWDLSAPANTPRGRRMMDNLHSRAVSPIDLVIRWGGMRRLSGLLPVQSVYADFYVVDALWPDFKPDDFHAAINWYDHQDITRGG